jgi:hypothetical protein
MLHRHWQTRVVVFQTAQVVAPEEAGAVDSIVERADGKREVDVCERRFGRVRGGGWFGDEGGTLAGADV